MEKNENKITLCSFNIEEYESSNEEENNLSYINKENGKLVVNSNFPDIESELITKYLPEDTLLVKMDGPISNESILKKKVKDKKAIIEIKYTFNEEEATHFVFYDGKQIWDTWFKEVYFNRDLKDVYFKHYKPINSLTFEMLAPQQSWEEGYCALFSLANARLRSKGKKLETMDKMLQAQKIKQELSTFTEINSEMHVNGIKIFGL